ncbi:hypothetical protein GCM10011351_24370 [Paraliobacillus quinghaiensis]|uniref:Uncharacterized protein n=1 Tax=Paraliobacillus quinghaiensis TaxID=470815 RepID=A0A917WVU8_9BACI|nr:hypothetical protein [Paraliobacillus quinghaiensis]GGM37290.1 hypothetical protein GCM10011351_24370 [Paraliobacillus quinghaiensis]
MFIKKRLYWLIPFLLILLAIGLVFHKNLLEVTEPPEDNWSRAISIGKSSINAYPTIEKEEDGSISLTHFKDKALAKTTYNDSFNEVNNATYPHVPVDKWTQLYTGEEQLYYFDYNSIYNQDGNEVVANVDALYPLQNHLLYLKANEIFEFNETTQEVVKLFTLEGGFDKTIPFQTSAGIMILQYQTSGDYIVQLQELNQSGNIVIFTENLELNYTETIEEVALADKSNGQISILIKTEQKNASGVTDNQRFYLLEHNRESGEVTKDMLTFSDPKRETNLSSIGDISINYRNEHLTFLFTAKGASRTKYRTASAFNIYQATRINDEMIVQRRSNTAGLSAKPQWIDNQTVAWIDRKSGENTIFLSSDQSNYIAYADQITEDDFLAILGKTMGMYAGAFFTFIFAGHWYLWPIGLLAILLITRKSLVDRNPNWVLYLCIGVYMAACYLTLDNFFIANIYYSAPNYLTFTGSSYIYTTLFAFIAFIIAKNGAKQHEWHISMELFYFVAIHTLLLMAFFGPYLI